MVKKIRRMLALQLLMWSGVVWYGWKNRVAVERSVRAARAAWNEVGGDPAVTPTEASTEQVVVAVIVPDARDADELDRAEVDPTAAAAPVPPEAANW